MKGGEGGGDGGGSNPGQICVVGKRGGIYFRPSVYFKKSSDRQVERARVEMKLCLPDRRPRKQ